jgi:hypothetical protein
MKKNTVTICNRTRQPPQANFYMRLLRPSLPLRQARKAAAATMHVYGPAWTLEAAELARQETRNTRARLLTVLGSPVHPRHRLDRWFLLWWSSKRVVTDDL